MFGVTKFNINIKIIIFAFTISLNSAFADSHGDGEPKFFLEGVDGFLNYGDPERTAANVKMLVREGSIVMEVYSPAWNFHGVETAPKARTDMENETVQKETARFTSEPNKYFRFEPKHFCSLKSISHRLEQVETTAKKAQSGGERWRAFDVRAQALFGCAEGIPERMTVDLFSAFPRIKKVNVQMIVNDAEVRRVTLTEEKPVIVIAPPAE